MMNNCCLTVANARTGDPLSSQLAALQNLPHRQRQIDAVMAALARHSAITSRELAEFEGLDRYMIARRLPDAERQGLVRRGESRPCAIAGKLAVTWVKV